METSVDTLVYQLEDDDTNVRWNTLQKLRRVAAVETSHFPVRNTRRFLQCIRRRIVGEADTNVAIEALRLLGDVMVSLGDNVDQILSAILPHLIPSLPKKRKAREQDGDSDDESETLHEEMFQVIRKYVNVSNDLQAVADLLVNIGLGSVHGAVREVSLVVLMRLLDERFQKRKTSTRGEHAKTSIGRGDKALIVALVQAIIPSLEDTNEKVVVAAEEAIAKLQAYWGSRFSTDVMKFLSTEDKQTLHEHQEPISDFLQACTSSVSPSPSPPQSSRPSSAASSYDTYERLRDSKSSPSSPSKVHPLNIAEQLHFGFLNADIVVTLTTNTTNSNTDWKRRVAAVEKLYAACKQVDASVLRGLTAEGRASRMDELEGLFDILVRLTQDVDDHLVKRALQITQILFRKLAPSRELANDGTRNGDDFNTGGSNDQDASSTRRKDAAFYMAKMLAPMVETAANFAGDDDEIEGFVYALLGQVFESGCVHVNNIEQVLAATSLRHRRSQVREEALKIWMVLLLITEREGLLSANYVPNAFVVQTLGRLLGDTTAVVRDLAFEVAAILAMVCCCNIYALLETFIDDEYVAERVDWAALRARLRRKQVPELRSNGTLRLKPAGTVRNAATNRSYQTSSSVEQSLDGISELRMMVPSNDPKSREHFNHEKRLTEPTKLAKSKEMIGGSHSDRSYFDQQKPNIDGGASSRTTINNEGGTTKDINEKLAALKKKMDQLRQPRAKRVRRPNSQETINAVRSEGANASMVDPNQQTLPRSKSSPEQRGFNPEDDVELQIQSKDEKFHLSRRDKRVHPGRVPLAVPAPEAFVSSSQPTTQHSPQHLQSLQSDVHSYEDRPLKSKFIEQQKTLATEEDTIPSRLSPDERPIHPKGATADTDQFDLTFLDTTEDVDNNEVPSARINKGERVMSLATRKRLEAKAKQDAQADSASPTIRASPARESDTHKVGKKPVKSKGGAGDDDTKLRPSGKQDPRYLELHEITPLMNPKRDLSTVLTQLQSEDWEKSFDALNTVRRLAIHHASLIDLGKVHAIVTEILKQVPNLRSSVSKNALLALESMCSAFSRAMDSEVENIIPILLKRCADSNAFVCESAAVTLHAVVLKCSTSRVISAMNTHVSSKAVPIRREVARGVHTLIVCQGDSILSSKELPLILQLVGRCLEDSHNEVRDIAKQSVLYLHYNHMPRDRIKRLLPAAAQAKVDSLLNGKTGYVSPMIPGPTSVAELVPELLDLPAVKKQEAAGASARPKKTAKQLSRRPSPPTSSNGTRANFNAEEMSRLEMKLDSSNWKDRFDALTETTEFICGNASAVMGSSQMLNLFDQLIKRLDDGNAKVNVLALECMDKIVPAVGTGIDQVLPNFVPVITKNLANARTSSLAQSVVQQLCLHADNRSLCQQFAIQTRNTNARVVPILLDTLTQLAAQSLDDKSNYVLTRHVLPMALDFLKEAKSGVKEANAKLLRQLRTTLGPTTVASAASKLSSSQQDKLAAILAR